MALSKDKYFDQVSGRVADSQQKKYEASKLCEPCLMDNDRTSAVGWCETCDEMLCSDCYKGHCKLKITRDHVLMSLEKMRTYKQMQGAPTTCKHHGGKPLEYYCESHNQLGCYSCFVGKHRACKRVVCINEMKSSQIEDFDMFRKYLNDFTARVNRSKKRASMAGSTVRQQYDQAVSEIQAAGTKMKDYIDRLVNAKLAEAQKTKKANLSIIESVTTINDEVEAKLEANTESLAFFTKEGNPRLLFINMLSIELASHALESNIQGAEKLDIKRINFVFNTHLSRIMHEVKEIGKLHEVKEVCEVDCINVCRIQSSTQVEKEVHVLALPTSIVYLDLHCDSFYFRRFNVSVSRGINLSHVLLYNQGSSFANMGIYEDQKLLFNFQHWYVKSSDEKEEVEVASHKRRGVFLLPGHTYMFTFDKLFFHDRHDQITRRLNQLTMRKESVTFMFSSEDKDVHTGPFAGMKFTLF